VTPYSPTSDGPSYEAAWSLAEARCAAEDAARREYLDRAARVETEVNAAAFRGGRPRTQPTHCPRCGRVVYARGLCQAHYRAERRAA
jgi:hypothetical protein